jgi:hypothetical protein
MLLRRSAAAAGIACLLSGTALAQSSAPGADSQPPAPTAAGQAPAPAAAAQPPAAAGDADELSRQATDPTASLMSFNFINDFRTSFYGVDDDGFEFRFQPVVPFRAWKTSNILRLVVPYQTDGPGNEGLKSVSIFDLVVLPQRWGRFGIGPVMNLAESESAAESKFSIGPALGAVVPISKKLNVGGFTQNLFASGVAITQLQPIVAYQLGSGWALSAGDLQFVYDWELGEWVSLPLGFQIGKVLKVAGQPMRFSLNPQWNLKDIDGANKAKVVFTVTLLAPGK